MDNHLADLYDAIINGDIEGTKEKVRSALDAGLEPERVLNEAMISAMQQVGSRFECGDYFVPEMLIAARAMKEGLKIIRPHLGNAGGISRGKIVIGTVKGDLHDIGKNLVVMMLEGAGYQVVDLGVDVPAESFVAAVKEHSPDVVGMSALLTTTMLQMETTVRALVDAGIRNQVKVILGGAPVNPEYASSIGADGYALDASRVTNLVNSLMQAQEAA